MVHAKRTVASIEGLPACCLESDRAFASAFRSGSGVYSNHVLAVAIDCKLERAPCRVLRAVSLQRGNAVRRCFLLAALRGRVQCFRVLDMCVGVSDNSAVGIVECACLPCGAILCVSNCGCGLCREFVINHYPELKKLNPTLPIYIRPCDGVEPHIAARYGT